MRCSCSRPGRRAGLAAGRPLHDPQPQLRRGARLVLEAPFYLGVDGAGRRIVHQMCLSPGTISEKAPQLRPQLQVSYRIICTPAVRDLRPGEDDHQPAPFHVPTVRRLRPISLLSPS